MDSSYTHRAFLTGFPMSSLGCVDIFRNSPIKLVGHVPIELSFLPCKFLARKGCHLEFSPTGSRYLEDGLVVPGKYLASAEGHGRKTRSVLLF